MSGVLWAIGAALAFSLGHMGIAKGTRAMGTMVGTLLLLVAGSAVIAAAAMAIEGPGRLLEGSAAALALFVAAGLIHFIGGWGLMNASTRRIGPSRMAAIVGVSPLFTAILAVAFLNESVNLFVGLGIAGIVAGTYLIATS